MGIGGLPSPAISAHVHQAAARAPAQMLLGEGGIRHAAGGIPFPSGKNHLGDGQATHRAVGPHHLQHRDALPRAQIQGEQGVLLAMEQVIQRAAVAFGQIHYMDEVPHAAAICCGPVVSIDGQRSLLPHGHLPNEGEQVGGLSTGILANAAAGMGPDRVEIAKPGDPPTPLASGHIGQQLLHRRFGVGIGMEGLQGRPLGDGQGGGEAIEAGTAAEDQGADAMALHGFQQAAAPVDVDVPITERLADRFSRDLQAGQMKHGLHGLQGKGAVHVVALAHIPLDHPQGCAAALGVPDRRGGGLQGGQHRQVGDPAEGLQTAVDKAVEHHDRVPSFQQAEGGVAPDESPAACDQEIGQQIPGLSLLHRTYAHWGTRGSTPLFLVGNFIGSVFAAGECRFLGRTILRQQERVYCDWGFV